MRGSWRLNRTATYWPPLLWPQQRFFSVLQAHSAGCWFSLLHLISNWSDLQLIWSPTATAQSEAWGPTLLDAGVFYCILSPTHWTSCALSYIIVQRPPSSCGCHKLHSFNPSMVKVIFWYSSTGCTSYLHRCISYFDSLAGSEVNIQQLLFFY